MNHPVFPIHVLTRLLHTASKANLYLYVTPSQNATVYSFIKKLHSVFRTKVNRTQLLTQQLRGEVKRKPHISNLPTTFVLWTQYYEYSVFFNNSAGDTRASDSHSCDGCMPQRIRDPWAVYTNTSSRTSPCQIDVPDLVNRGPVNRGALGGQRSRGTQTGHREGDWASQTHSVEPVWVQSQRGSTMAQ